MIIRLVKFLAIAAVLCGMAGIVIWRPFWIPAGSMKPTLLVGDYIAVKRFEKDAQVGDVIVFTHPVSGFDFIKRVVGVAGDRIAMENGVPVINDVKLDVTTAERFIEDMAYQGASRSLPRCANGAVALQAECIKEQSFETLPNGVAHAVLNIGDQSSDDTGIFTVPEGHLFVLGDNRDNSTDSRVPSNAGGVGFVPVDNVIGTVDFVVFSSAGRSLLDVPNWRFDRFFEAVE